ncbi:Thymidine phosphorylase [Verrucomicrobia bacterium]|nr:Thymidine phosphorylase [Verrucomicrobiota bacterium]
MSPGAAEKVFWLYAQLPAVCPARVNFLSVIEAKRDGQALSGAQLQEIIRAFTAGQLPDYQMAAFLMAVYFRGLNTTETRALTLAMRESGEVLEFPPDPRPLVDKHSTGGVGDKVSLPLTPLLASLGFRVPMVSGRGLGITGGTLDKLESISGFNTSLPAEQVVELVQRVGCVICGQTERMVPADKALYALRDATSTVPSRPLIVSSILSKKLAEGLDALILDVKCGAAAFMPTFDEGRTLARELVDLGNECGVHTRALLTDMDTPLGRAAGNWLEVKEAVACLEAGDSEGDLCHLVVECAAHLLAQTGRAETLELGRHEAQDCLVSGKPRQKWEEMLAAQGADLVEFKRRLGLDDTAGAVAELRAWRAGFVRRCDARILGEVIRDLGGGRLTKESIINHEVGVDRLAKPGEWVDRDAVLARVHAAKDLDAETARERVASAFEISEQKPEVVPLIREVVSGKP